MKTSEFQKYINKRVELRLTNDNRIYKGIIREWEYNFVTAKRLRYEIIDEYNNVCYVFRPSHVKSIKELENEK